MPWKLADRTTQIIDSVGYLGVAPLVERWRTLKAATSRSL